MANNPIPDSVPSMMEADFGTTVLITDPKSDQYLKKPDTTLPMEKKEDSKSM